MELLQPVARGERLGALVDLAGAEIERYSSPRDGAVVLIHALPPVEPGEPVFLVTGVEEQPRQAALTARG